MMNDLILSIDYLKRRAYVMFCCKLAKFFNRKILHFKFVPRWFPVVSRYHKLHVILLFIIEWVDAHKDHTYVVCMYVWLKHISWYNHGNQCRQITRKLKTMMANKKKRCDLPEWYVGRRSRTQRIPLHPGPHRRLNLRENAWNTAEASQSDRQDIWK